MDVFVFFTVVYPQNAVNLFRGFIDTFKIFSDDK